MILVEKYNDVNKSNDIARILVGGFSSTFVLSAFFISLSEINIIVGSWVWLAVCSVVLAAIIFLPLQKFWRWLLRIENELVRFLANIIAISPILFCIMLNINFAFTEPGYNEKSFVVNRVYKETRYQTKRVSRKVYTRGAPYSVNRVEISDGKEYKHSFDIKKRLYDRLMTGDTVLLPLKTGCLGIEFTDPESMTLRTPRTPEIKRESAREKRHKAYQEHIDHVLNRN